MGKNINMMENNNLLLMKENNSKTDPEIKKLVIARLSTISPNRRIAIGCFGDFDVNEAIQHVDSDDEIGKLFVEIEMEYLKSIKEGLFTF